MKTTLLLSYILSISSFGLNCNEKINENRTIKYWIANPNNLLNKTSNSCSTVFLNNFSKYNKAINVLAPYLWTTSVVNSTYAKVVPMDNSVTPCYKQLLSIYSNLSIGASGGIGECWNSNCNAKVMSRDPSLFINLLSNFINNQSFSISEVWLDFETKYLDGNDTANINNLFNMLSNVYPTYRYAGCVHNGEPAYLNETCKDFINGAPNVTVQGAGTYWDNSPDGFKKIFLDMISDIGIDNVDRLSVAVCPDCDHYDQITQEQLYDRMDLLCRHNIKSISAFTIDEIMMLNGINGTGDRWMKAFMYYRTGRRV